MYTEILSLKNDEVRLSIQDGLAAAENIGLHLSSVCLINVTPYTLIGGDVIYFPALQFFHSNGMAVSPLSPSPNCRAHFEGLIIYLGLAQLQGAIVDFSGKVKLRDNRTVHGVTLTPKHRNSPFTEMETKILLCVINACELIDTCLRNIRLSDTPNRYVIDRHKLIGLTIDLSLNQVQREYLKLYNDKNPPSVQTISALFRGCGIVLRKKH